MAEDSRDIKMLIKLQKQRPAFSRVISWEISDAAEYQPVKKGKQRKRKKPLTGTENYEGEKSEESASPDEEVSDDSSDYETACEEEEEGNDGDRDRSTRDFEGLFDSIGSDVLDTLDDSDTSSDDGDEEQEDELFTSCMGSDTTVFKISGEQEKGRKRRPSKKQKRKRRHQFKVCLNGLYNLGNLFDATDEISNVFTDVTATRTVGIQHRVPTLVELCLKANRRKERNNSQKGKNGPNKSGKQRTELPYGMKKLISHWGWSQKQLENQLSFFLNKVLPHVEHKDYVEHVKTEMNESPKPFFPKRSVWVNLPYPPKKSMLKDRVYGSETTPTFLYTPSLHYHHEIGGFNYSYKDYYVYDDVRLNNAMWALGTTIDLMLPSETGTSSITRSIFLVKRVLSWRYKNLVDVFFENTIPYVMWARGKIAMATDLFKNLIEKETEINMRAMYLSEIARMHAMFGDSKTAEQFYSVATETALEECNSERRDRCINEATEQKQILLASIYDTGVLDKEKASQSYTYWTGVKNLPTVRTATMIAGLDALLCYHLSHLPGSKPFDEAIAKVEKVTKECEYAYYYQSMLHALNGASEMSTKLYSKSRSCCSMTPGEAVLPYIRQRERNPWQPLIDLVNTQAVEVMPLNVIWRTNLQPPRLSTVRPMEGQVNSKELNLRLNDEGHVTGDMQMMMPPMRDISLNPYTGFVTIGNQPSQTRVWTSACLYQTHSHDLLVPTYRLIFSGTDGTTIHILKPSNTKTSLRNSYHVRSIGPPCSFSLHWKSPYGQLAKLNVHALLTNKVKEDIGKSLEARKKNYMTHWNLSKAMYFKLFELMDMAVEKDIFINEQFVFSTVVTYNKDLKKAEQAEKDRKIKGHKLVNSSYVKPQKRSLSSYLEINSSTKYTNWEIINEPFMFGTTVLLTVRALDYIVYCVLVNTENKNTFLSSSVVSIKHDKLIPEQFRNNYTDEEYFMNACDYEMYVMNKSGATVLTLKNRYIAKAARNGLPPVIIYPNIFGVNKEKNSIWRVILSVEKETECVEDVEDKICWSIDSLREELLGDTGYHVYIKELTFIGNNASSTGKLLMANLNAGLTFIDPNSLEFVPIKIKKECAKYFKLTNGHYALKGDFENVKILAEKVVTVDNRPVCRAALGAENQLFVLDITRQQDDSTIHLEVICLVVLPGFPKEVCFVGSKVGMLITFTQHSDERDQYYREHLFHFDYDGCLHGVLLCLSQGPKSFLPVYLHGNSENESEGTYQAGWHVYLRDGRDGIMCLRLS